MATTKVTQKPTEYELHATEFLESIGVTFAVKLLGHFPYFPDDVNSRDVYEVTLARNGRKWSFRFGQSLNASKTKDKEWRPNEGPLSHYQWLRQVKSNIKPPSAYDVLAALTKTDPGSFAEFCGDFGYATDSIKARDIYIAVQDEWANVRAMFHDVMAQLEQIQ